ncbi:FAD-binding protein [Patescibacteria group bacterium]|nr:FAD-binding protein [Patescibacteria group bacterium]
MADEQIRKGLLRQIVKVEDDYSLRRFSPLKTGGVADYFTEAVTAVELAAAVKAAIDMRIPYLVIGNGSRVVFSDSGFPGLVIHNLTHAYGIDRRRSQIVADSGLPLSRFITLAASEGLGGLTHLYGEEGTIGGAIYHNTVADRKPIFSSIRYVTMVMPPARIDREATIVRYRSDWLEKNAEQTKLRFLRESRDFHEPQPVLLTALFQLTSVRVDELRTRLWQASRLARAERPKGAVLGPIFQGEPDLPLSDLLVGSQVAKLRIGGVSPHRRFPNYIVTHGRSIRAADIRELIIQMQGKLWTMYGAEPRLRYEFLGIW